MVGVLAGSNALRSRQGIRSMATMQHGRDQSWGCGWGWIGAEGEAGQTLKAARDG